MIVLLKRIIIEVEDIDMINKNRTKPCPFCSGKPHFEKDFDGYRFYHTCKKLKPQINIHSCFYESKQKAVDAWNTRAE